MQVLISAHRLALVFLLLIALGCTDQGSSATANSATSTAAEQQLQELEDRIRQTRARLQSTRQLLLVSGFVGLSLLTGCGLLLWRQANNRRQDIKKLSRAVNKLQEELRSHRSKSRKGIRRRQSSKKKGGRKVVPELERRIEELEDEVERLKEAKKVALQGDKGAKMSERRTASSATPPTEESKGETTDSGGPRKGRPHQEKSSSQVSKGREEEERTSASRSKRTSATEEEEHHPSEETASSSASTEQGAHGLGSSSSSGAEPGTQVQDGSASREGNSSESLIDDFNRFLRGSLSETDFQEQHDPIKLGIENEEERLDRAQAPVVLHKHNRGQYLGVKREDHYLVLPGYNLVLDDSVRKQAGFDQVFQCGDVSHHQPYQVKRLDRAARFVRKRQEQFVLDTEGNVALERYG